MVTAPRGRLRRALVALVLSVLLLVTTACGRQPSTTGSNAQAPLTSQPPSGALQEVAPPGGVQQLNAGLNERAPRVEVLAPADNSVLPEGPWTLKLRVQDWPLADAGPLGLGPHVVVQLDDAPPLRLTSPAAVREMDQSVPLLGAAFRAASTYRRRSVGAVSLVPPVDGAR